MHKFTTLTFLCAISFLASCQENFDHRLQREAKEYTQRHCPNRIEAGTTLDSVTYSPTTRTYTSWYTFSEQLDSPVAHQATLNNLDKVKEHLNKKLRGDTKWETCKENQINFKYVYRSAILQKELFHIVLTPEDYRH